MGKLGEEIMEDIMETLDEMLSQLKEHSKNLLTEAEEQAGAIRKVEEAAETRGKAEDMVADAQRRAEGLVADAQDKAEGMAADAQGKAEGLLPGMPTFGASSTLPVEDELEMTPNHVYTSNIPNIEDQAARLMTPSPCEHEKKLFGGSKVYPEPASASTFGEVSSGASLEDQSIEARGKHNRKLNKNQAPAHTDPANLELQKLYRKAVEYRLAHGFFQRQCSSYNDAVSFTVLSLATVAGLFLFYGDAFKDVCAALTAVITALTGFGRFMDFSGRSEAHSISQKMFGKIQRNGLTGLTAMDRERVNEELPRWLNDFENAVIEMPVTPVPLLVGHETEDGNPTYTIITEKDEMKRAMKLDMESSTKFCAKAAEMKQMQALKKLEAKLSIRERLGGAVEFVEKHKEQVEGAIEDAKEMKANIETEVKKVEKEVRQMAGMAQETRETMEAQVKDAPNKAADAQEKAEGVVADMQGEAEHMAVDAQLKAEGLAADAQSRAEGMAADPQEKDAQSRAEGTAADYSTSTAPYSGSGSGSGTTQLPCQELGQLDQNQDVIISEEELLKSRLRQAESTARVSSEKVEDTLQHMSIQFDEAFGDHIIPHLSP